MTRRHDPAAERDAAGEFGRRLDATAKAALDAVSAALTTDDLVALNKKVDSDRQDPDQVAAEWLKSKSLA